MSSLWRGTQKNELENKSPSCMTYPPPKKVTLDPLWRKTRATKKNSSLIKNVPLRRLNLTGQRTTVEGGKPIEIYTPPSRGHWPQPTRQTEMKPSLPSEANVPRGTQPLFQLRGGLKISGPGGKSWQNSPSNQKENCGPKLQNDTEIQKSGRPVKEGNDQRRKH